MSRGFTLDTGALIALERRQQRARIILATGIADRVTMTVPAAVVTEWWRGRTDHREEILAAVYIEPLDDSLARIAGDALASVRGATAIDAMVMASAARRGDRVYTSDVHDLERLRAYFPTVRVLGIG